MERLQELLEKAEAVNFTGRPNCIEHLDNRVQDILFYLEAIEHKASGELLELRGCSWVLHERYHMDSEEQLMWTFHHTKHKIVRSCRSLLESGRLKPRRENQRALEPA